MLRIIHVADAHLDTPFYGRETLLRQKLRAGTRRAFTGAVEAALDRRVDAFLIAGDLFDSATLSFATESFLLAELNRLREAGIPVFYATGNHDPGRAGDRVRRLAWPSNVHLFYSSCPETVPLGRGGRLTAAGYADLAAGENLAAAFPPAGGDGPHLAMLHAQVTTARGAAGHERYAPCSAADLAAPGFAYWALGHIHLRGQVAPGLPAWYPGNLQGRNPRETGPRGALYVEISPGREPSPEFLPLAPVQWHWLEARCPREAVTLEALAAALAGACRQQVTFGGEAEHLVRLDISGQSPLARELADEENIAELSATLAGELGVAWLETRVRRVVRPVDPASFRGSPTVLGQALELLEQARTDTELRRRLGPAPAALGAADEDAYRRSLLDGAEEELAARLLPEDGP